MTRQRLARIESCMGRLEGAPESWQEGCSPEMKEGSAKELARSLSDQHGAMREESSAEPSAEHSLPKEGGGMTNG